MTLDDLIKDLSPKLAFMLGGIAIAHSERARARRKYKESEVAFNTAERENRSMGFYEDCGSFYQTLLDRAEGEKRIRSYEETSKEKHFKKLGHEFVEAGGDPAIIAKLQEILNDNA